MYSTLSVPAHFFAPQRQTLLIKLPYMSNLTRHNCSCSLDGTIVDTTPLVCLYLLARLLQAELEKCLRLVSNLPVQDMDTYLGNNNNIQLSESI